MTSSHAGPAVTINEPDVWVKVVDMLQQNWAFLVTVEGGLWHAYFIGDTSGIFDELGFPTRDEAVAALRRNGFRRHADDASLAFLRPPQAPFVRSPHPNGPIYSSGRLWR